MAWVDRLSGTIVALDTTPLIYYIERHRKYLPVVRPFFMAMDRGEFQVVTSIITLLEVLVHPLRQGNVLLARRYRDILLSAAGLTTYPISAELAEAAASLRATFTIRTPDALQLATALSVGAMTFLTNDAGLPRPPGMTILLLDDLASQLSASP